MSKKKKTTKSSDENSTMEVLGILSIAISLPMILASIGLLIKMMAGIDRNPQYGYSMGVVFLLFLGIIPSILSIIFGAIAFSKFHKNEKFSSPKMRTFAIVALSMPIASLALILFDAFLDAFLF